MQNIILIGGKARNGKDTAAEYLREKLIVFGKHPIIIHYADLLKYLCKQYFGWNGEKDKQGRTLLQHIGTDVIRNKNPDFWVEQVYSFVENVFYDKDYIIIPDCRFPNEIDYWKGLQNSFPELYNAVSLKMIRTNYESELTYAQQKHPSEIALDNYKFDWYIRASTLDELYKQCEYFMKEKILINDR